MSHFKSLDKFSRETLLRTQVRVDVMLELQARILSELTRKDLADVKKEIDELVGIKMHHAAQELFIFDLDVQAGLSNHGAESMGRKGKEK